MTEKKPLPLKRLAAVLCAYSSVREDTARYALALMDKKR